MDFSINAIDFIYQSVKFYHETQKKERRKIRERETENEFKEQLNKEKELKAQTFYNFSNYGEILDFRRQEERVKDIVSEQKQKRKDFATDN